MRTEEIIYSVRRYYRVEEQPAEFGPREPEVTDWRNLDRYYSILSKERIPNYDAFWRKLVLGQFLHKHNRELVEYMHGALERYKHALLARDITEQLLHKTTEPDNDIVFLVNFHFYYFITILKTLGDNLAWILNYFYSMGLESTPSSIDLTKTKFRHVLARKNGSLLKIICQGPEYEQYRTLRDFRDIVVHKHALHVVPVQHGVNGPTKIMAPIDPARRVMVDDFERRRGTVRIAHSQDKDSVAEYGLKTLVVSLVQAEELGYEDVSAFCDRHLKYLTDAYCQVIKQIISA
jgi:alpha-amylase/alpha-mannosidase (GH57 family)